MKLKMAAVALACCVTFMCSESNADLLGRMLGRGGCGGGQTVSSCCDTPAPVCGGRNFGISININIGMPGRLFRGNNCGGGCGLFKGGLFNRGGGCDSAPAMGCNSAPAPVMANFGDCGCGADDGCGGGRLRGLLSGIRGRLSSIGNCGGCGMAAGDCGCGAPVMAQPAPACGPTCGDGCGLGGGLFQGGLLGRLRGGLSGGCGTSIGDCGCQAAPAPVAAPCGCGNDTCGGGCGLNLNLRGRVSGLLSRLKPDFGGCGAGCGGSDCGCGNLTPAPAPVACGGCGAASADSCGCGLLSRVKGIGQGVGSRIFGRCGSCGRTACDGGCGGSRLSLMSRLRGDRTVRNPCITGCQPACPNSGCGGACNTCGGGVQYGNTMAQPMQAAPMMQSAPTMAPQAAPQVTPPAVPVETNGSIQVPAATTPDTSFRQPVVDPSAFIVRN